MDDPTWLGKVAENHREWIKIAKVYGAGSHAEDLVQDMYLKLHKYASPEKVVTDGKMNKGYVFFTLRSVVSSWHKKKRHPESEMPLHLEHIDNSEIEEAWGRFVSHVDKFVSKWRYTDKLLFQEYFAIKNPGEDPSFRSMGEKYGISWVSIFSTVKNCRDKIRDEFGDKYETLKRGDFEKI